MRRPTVRRKQPGVALFPFLAVLICTMGSLIVLLVLVVQQARAGVASRNKHAAAPEVDSEQLRQLHEQEEDLQWQAEMLQGVRDKNAEALANKRLELSHLEDHIRRLEDDARKIAEQVKALQNSGRGELADTSSANQQLTEMQREIVDKKKQLDAARKDLLRRKPAYAIVPYDGPNGTSRRPMYIECTEDGIVIQPEGIRFAAEDFQGPMGPGNPLDAALRAIREHWKQAGLQGEPYPLIVVRPSGAVAFGAARSAMKHWESEFGYELVDDITELKYPTPDPTLASTVNRAVQAARQRQAILAASMPNRFAGEARLTSFRAEDNAEPGDDAGGAGGGSGGGSGYAGSRAGGGSGSGSGFGGGGNALGSGNAARALGSQPSGGEGTENFGSGGEGPYGLSQGGQYATPGVPGGTGRGGTGGSGNGTSGNETGGSGTTAGSNGATQTARGSAQTAAGSGASRAGGSQAGQTGNGYASTKPTEQAAAMGPRSQGPNGATNNGAAYAGGTAGGGSATGAKNYQGGSTSSGMGSNSQSGSPGGSSATSSSSANSSSSGASGASSSSNDPSSMNSNSSTPSLDLSKQQAKARKATKHRGENWGLPNSSPKATAVTRPIRIECYADQLMLMPEKGELRTPLVVPIEDNLAQNLDAFVDAVWTHMSRWGIAVLGGYWKPVLLIDVKPGGEERFLELQQLLRGSGMEVQRRSQ